MEERQCICYKIYGAGLYRSLCTGDIEIYSPLRKCWIYWYASCKESTKIELAKFEISYLEYEKIMMLYELQK